MNHAHPINQKKCQDLWQAVLTLKNKSECKKFFRDLCTLEEIIAMADRWQAVKKIVKDEPYRNIAKRLNMSTTTVARVAYWLKYGEGGYRLVLKRIGLKLKD